MKVKVTQDFLYDYLTERSVNMKKLAELMGVSPATVSGCFRHQLNTRGKQRSFTGTALSKLNTALPIFATLIRDRVIPFGTPETFTNSCGRTYDPGTIPAFKELSKYFNLTGLCESVLGWKEAKKVSVLCTPAGKVYGNITADDVTKVNIELLSVAGVLDRIEIVSDTSCIKNEKLEGGNVEKPKEKKVKKKKFRKGDGLHWNWMGELPNQE